MTEYKSGDWVLIRGRVSETYHDGPILVGFERGERIIVPAEIVGPTEPPLPPEPDHDSLVIDREHDVWRWEEDGYWHLVGRSVRLSWDQIASTYAPFRVLREVQCPAG